MTPAKLTFPPIPSGTYAFPTADAFNSWFRSVTVAISGDNIPTATVTTYGTVLVASYPFLFWEDPGPNFVYVAVTDVNALVQSVPSQAAFDALYELVKAIANNVNSMQTGAATAGQAISLA